MKIDVCASIGTSNLNQMPNQCENAENSVEFGSIIKQAIGQGSSQNANAKTDDTATPLTQAPVKSDVKHTKIETEILDINAESLILAQFTPSLNFVENVDLSVDTCEISDVVTTVDSVQAVDENAIALPVQSQPDMPVDVADSFNQQLPTVDNVQSQPIMTIDAEQPERVIMQKTAEFDVQTQTNSATFNNEVADRLTPLQTVQEQASVDNAQPTLAKDFAVSTVEVETAEIAETDKVVAKMQVPFNVQNAVEKVTTDAVVAEQAVPIVKAEVEVSAEQPIDAENVEVVAKTEQPLNVNLTQTADADAQVVENVDLKMATTKQTVKTEQLVDANLTQTVNVEHSEIATPKQTVDVDAQVVENIDLKIATTNQTAKAEQSVDANSTQTVNVEHSEVIATKQKVTADSKQQDSDALHQNFAKDDTKTDEIVPQQAKTMSNTQGIEKSRQSAEENVASVKLETETMHSATVNVVTTQKTATLTQVESVSDTQTVESVKTQILTEIYDKYQNGINDFEIRLKPNELGEVTVKMAVKGSELVIELVAHDSKTEQIILSSSNEIKEILQTQLNQTVVIEFVDNENTQFDYNDGSQNREQQHHENQQNQNQNEQNNLTDDFLSLMMKIQSVKF